MNKVAIIGSHGLYANYGGWDQLVNNLAERKTVNINYLIFNSNESARNKVPPNGVKIIRIGLKASGFQGLFFDFWTILISFFKVNTILLLGVQGIPIIPFLNLFKKTKIISNVGGVEWERPKFGFFSKRYLRFCFNLSFKYSKAVILDNEYYLEFVPKNSKAIIEIISYGGEIDISLRISNKIRDKFPFIVSNYFLSISRSLKDNLLDELCESFIGSKHTLVLISNLTNSVYGNMVYNKYINEPNIVLINGLYIKPELDLLRRTCTAYIHTHTLCGTAPSLVEMIISQRPIISIDIPQNRFTLKNQAFFYSSFSEIQDLINSKNDLSEYIPSFEICKLYDWNKIVLDYEKLY